MHTTALSRWYSLQRLIQHLHRHIQSLKRHTQCRGRFPTWIATFATGTFSAPTPDEPVNYGGFYTQDDIKELVQYAKQRFVNILPEIDVPGHSLATVASYPELSCTEDAKNYRVRSGEEIMDWSHGAPPIALVDNTLCPANEKVYVFLDKVLTEVAQLLALLLQLFSSPTSQGVV